MRRCRRERRSCFEWTGREGEGRGGGDIEIDIVYIILFFFFPEMLMLHVDVVYCFSFFSFFFSFIFSFYFYCSSCFPLLPFLSGFVHVSSLYHDRTALHWNRHNHCSALTAQ